MSDGLEAEMQMHQHMPHCHEMPHQEVLGGRASTTTANNRTVLIPCVLSIHISSNTVPSHAMFDIKPFPAMIYLFFLQSINI
jgi:hypothetical protein